jgi:nicotinate phosphoribosyltransferase
MGIRIAITVGRVSCAALLTDKYELTMLAAALADGTAHRRTTFEVFARRLPDGRRYGVVAGTARLLEALADLVFDDVALASVAPFLDTATCEYLSGFRFRGDIDGYAEGELYFPGSPVLSVTVRRTVKLPAAVGVVEHAPSTALLAAAAPASLPSRPPCSNAGRRL